MICRLNKNKGQAALILILLTAAGLIFYAVILNWGRIAQEKALLTVAADQAAAYLASEGASYGQMEKAEYLKDKNELSASTGVLMAIIMVVVAIIVTIFSWGTALPGMVALLGAELAAVVTDVILVVSVVMSIVNLVLQVCVINPMITTLWNKLQKNQPIVEQFYEPGVSTAMSGIITDQVSITDYLDSNANGLMGVNSKRLANDSIGRFAFFYTERLKILNNDNPIVPQIIYFYDKLGQFMHGQTCADNYADNQTSGGTIPINKNCVGLNCNVAPATAGCQTLIPGGFRLDDPCPTNSNPSDPAYNPYCDPCCQPYYGSHDPYYNPKSPGHASPYLKVRPVNCPFTNANCFSASCLKKGGTCSASDQACALSSAWAPPAPECITNNPYNPTQTFGTYPYLYDSTYQNYGDQISFLAKLGRDQPMPAGTPPTFNTLTPDVVNPMTTPIIEFPNGAFPFFWLMKKYSLQVDNILSSSLSLSQRHWCSVSATSSPVIPAAPAAPTGFPDLAQLNLTTYSCKNQSCCVNSLANNPANLTSTSSIQIDVVGDPSYGSNPAQAVNSFGGQSLTGSWVPGDDQFCATAFPYNGSSVVIPDGLCAVGYTPGASIPNPISGLGSNPSPTIDNLDNVEHILSGFDKFAQSFLSQDVGNLNTTLNTWYPQVAEWVAPACGSVACSSAPEGVCTGDTCHGGCASGVACSGGVCQDGSGDTCGQADGRLLSIYNPYTGYDLLQLWAGVPGVNGATQSGIITNWLSTNYTSSTAWCVPVESSLQVSGSPTAEDNYIKINGVYPANGSIPASLGTWGDLGHVIACLNYNAAPVSAGAGNSAAYAFQQCYNDLTAAICPSTASTDCSALTLGRTLVSPTVEPKPTWNGKCNGLDAKFMKWVNDSLTLANDQAPKFALRSMFLTDIYNRARNMQNIFNQADAALKAFLAPCKGTNCSGGGPAAQLMWARKNPSPTVLLPNSVIYGWVDKNLPNGNKGYAHIVKVTAYSMGRDKDSLGNSYIADSLLPWIKTSTSGFLGMTRHFTLTDRDGYVYVSVKRWDQDYANALTFPNQRPLWQFMYHNPDAVLLSSKDSTGSLPPECLALGALPGSDAPYGTGFGITPAVYNALMNFSKMKSSTTGGKDILKDDATALGNAFMLTDAGTGKLDYLAGQAKYNCTYNKCLDKVNALVASGIESHACAEYVATDNPNEAVSQNEDQNYKIIFVDCSKAKGGTVPPDDLLGWNTNC